MKKLDLAQTVGILANVGVIAGILFLAVELQQNNQILTAQARTTRMEVRKEATNTFLENPELVRLLLKSQHGEPLTEEDRFRLDGIIFLTTVTFQHSFTEYQNGLIDEEEIPISGWRNLYHERFPGFPDYWAGNKGSFRQDFVDWMEENVVNVR